MSNSSKPSILINAPIETRSGYGSRARDLVRSIIKLNRFDVSINSTNWGTTPLCDVPDLKQYILPPRSFFKPNVLLSVDIPTDLSRVPADYKILVTAGLEANRISPEWIAKANTANLVVFSSTFAKDIFTNSVYQNDSGVTHQLNVPTTTLFEGVDTNVYKPQSYTSKKVRDELSRIPEKFLYLYVGHFISRKNVAQLVNLFTACFRDMVGPMPALVLKTSSAGYSYSDVDNILKNIKRIQERYSGKLPNVYVIYGDMTDAEMNELYNHDRVKCHITATHGEGYGRPLAEASQSAKPMIVPDWSGHLEFCPEDMVTRVKGTMVEIPEHGIPMEYTGQGSRAWFEVEPDAFVKALRDVHSNYDEHLKKASLHQQHVKQNYSLAKMDAEVEKLFKSHVPPLFADTHYPWRGL